MSCPDRTAAARVASVQRLNPASKTLREEDRERLLDGFQTENDAGRLARFHQLLLTEPINASTPTAWWSQGQRGAVWG